MVVHPLRGVCSVMGNCCQAEPASERTQSSSFVVVAGAEDTRRPQWGHVLGHLPVKDATHACETTPQPARATLPRQAAPLRPEVAVFVDRRHDFVQQRRAVVVDVTGHRS